MRSEGFRGKSKAQKEIAISLKERGMSETEIADIMKMSIEEIKLMLNRNMKKLNDCLCFIAHKSSLKIVSCFFYKVVNKSGGE